MYKIFFSPKKPEIKIRHTFASGVSLLNGYGGECNCLDNTTSIKASHDFYINPAQMVVSLPWEKCCHLEDITTIMRHTVFVL